MNNTGETLKLHTKLKFWYQHFVKGQDSFEDSLKPVAQIETVEQFWAYYQNFKRPTEMDVGSYIYLFKNNVKPAWEDQHNKNGGAFVLRFERSKCDRLWQDILLGFISGNEQVFAHFNGLRIKVKKDFAEIDFWISKINDDQFLQFCRQWIIKVTTLENDTPLEVLPFHSE